MKLMPLNSTVIDRLSADGYQYLVNRDYRYDALFYSSKKIITFEAVQQPCDEDEHCISLSSDEVQYYLDNEHARYYVIIAS